MFVNKSDAEGPPWRSPPCSPPWGWKTLIVFGSFNFVSLPLVYIFCPETNGRSLEEFNLLFAADSPIVSANGREFERMLSQAGGNVAVAERRMMEEVDAQAGEKDFAGVGERIVGGFEKGDVLE